MKRKKLKLSLHFLKNKLKAESLFRWKKVKSEIRNRNDEVIFQMQKVEAPKDWSQLAIDIAASKYFRKTGVPQGGCESSIKSLVHRVVSVIKASGLQQKYYFSSQKEANIFEQELSYILLSQRGAFNSPVWFNVGLWELYHIASPSEHFAWDFQKNKVIATKTAYESPQCSACFIQSVDDSIEGIFELAKTEAKLFKYGSGTGTNFSRIRSHYEFTSSGEKSSGLLSFLEVLDKGAGAIKSGGTSRRAAKMVIVDIDHPEILEFIDWKWREELKARALIHAGWSADFEGEAYKTVSGQNSNNSVRVTDSYMRAVQQNKSWSLKERLTGRTFKKLPAKELWHKIIQAAWSCADPGLQFHDTINQWHTCSVSALITASNPCSEYMFIDDSACNLSSINLVKCLSEDGTFDLDSFIHTARILFIAQEILIDYSSYPTEKIAQNSHQFRPLGLGFSNLGSFLMRQGVPYDSEKGRALAGAITALMTGIAYLTSAELAAIKGSFSMYKKNHRSMLKVINKHSMALANIPWSQLPPEWEKIIKQFWHDLKLKGAEFGFRNAQVTAIAPTGTIGLLMDCDTMGIEPEYALIKIKKLSGGGEIRIINQAVSPALKKLGYSTDEIEKILKYIEENNSVAGCSYLKEKDYAVFDCANSEMGKRFLLPESHLKMMAAVQPFVSGAISKTVNLPTSASEEDISKIYFTAWELGLKSISIYRDQSKQSQPLTQGQNINKKQSPFNSDRANQEDNTETSEKTKTSFLLNSLESSKSSEASQSSKTLEPSESSIPMKSTESYRSTNNFRWHCPECGFDTQLMGGCYRCPNCGTTVGCS